MSSPSVPSPPVGHPEPEPVDSRIAAAPSWNDPTVARASQAIGGPIGRYAAASRTWSPLVVLLMMTGFTLLLAFAQKSPCANADWHNNNQYTRVCYSDIIPLWSTESLDVGDVPYRDHAVEYPAVTGGYMWLTAEGVHAVRSFSTSLQPVVLFGLLTDVGLAVCALLITYFAMGTTSRRPWDAAIFAASPLLIFHAFSNWDLLAMAFTAAAMWAWSREKTIAAGALIGLGAAAKLYPALLLVGIIALAIRTGKHRAAAWCSATALVTWLAVNVPIALAYDVGWRQFFAFNFSRSTEWDTIWGMGYAALHNGVFTSWEPPGLAVAGLTIVGELAVMFLALRAPRRPRLAQLMFLAVLVFLFTNKIWSRQYSLWLLPLIAGARPKWRITLIWQFSEIVVWIVFLQYLLGLGDSNRTFGYGWLVLVVLIRDGVLLVIAGLVVRDVWFPDLDVVRSDGLDDPGGGPFDGAPDVVVITGRTAGYGQFTDEELAEPAAPPT